MPEPHNYLVVLEDSTTYEDMEMTNMNKESRSNIILTGLKTIHLITFIGMKIKCHAKLVRPMTSVEIEQFK